MTPGQFFALCEEYDKTRNEKDVLQQRVSQLERHLQSLPDRAPASRHARPRQSVDTASVVRRLELQAASPFFTGEGPPGESPVGQIVSGGRSWGGSGRRVSGGGLTGGGAVFSAPPVYTKMATAANYGSPFSLTPIPLSESGDDGWPLHDHPRASNAVPLRVHPGYTYG